MKNKRYLGLAILFLLILLPAMYYSEVKCYDGKLQTWLTLNLREYWTDTPISNVSISVGILISGKRINLRPYVSDEFGKVSVYLGEFSNKELATPPKLTDLTLSNNYTLIKVNSIFLEDVKYSAQYVLGQTQFSNMQIALEQETSGNKSVIKANCWVLKGKLITVSDCDPVTGEKSVADIKIAAKAILKNETEIKSYESLYFVPLNYEVLISHAPKTKVEYWYPPLKVLIDENTSIINWMYHAAKSYGNYRMNLINKEVYWLKSAGLSVNREVGEYEALENLLKRVLSLYERRDYSAALSGMRILKNRMTDLETWLSNLRILALIGTISISLFTYSLSSILSGFIFEEPTKNRERLITKVMIFISLLIFFSLADPSSKIAYALIIEGALNSPVPEINTTTVLLGTLIIGALTYFLITLVSVKRSPITSLALQLGVRSLKRRPVRTLLTLITIIIIVSSSMIFVNICVARETKVRSSWPSTNFSGLIIKSGGSLGEISAYDVKWIEEQEWCKEVSYMEKIKELEPVSEGSISRTTLLNTGTETRVINVIFLDPVFMDKYYNFSRYVRGFWKDFLKGEKVILLPTKYDVAIGEYVTLSLDETLLSGEPVYLGRRNLGQFRVIGKFETTQISALKKIDNSLLFEDTSNIVLIPIDAIKDPSVTISEVTVVPNFGYDPLELAKELAYLLGFQVIANKNGLAVLVVWSLEISSAGFIQFTVPIIVAGLMTYVTMSSIYEERKRETLVLATLGLDPRNTLLVFLVEALLLGLLGTFIGFFGTYILSVMAPLTLTHYANPSVFTFFAALFVGTIMVFLGGYVPSVRAQGLSLMGRMKTRKLLGELIDEGDNFIFPLPIRESIQNSELLYNYSRETLEKLPSSLVDHRSIKGEIYGDGSFNISFAVPATGAFIPCNLRGEKNEDIIVLSIAFPKSFREYERIRKILRDLESYMIGFSTWRDMQLRMKIVREAPKKQKTMDEVLEEMKTVIEQIKDFNKKLGILEAQKGKLAEEIYNEFRQKYLSMIDEKYKFLRSISIGLESYSSKIQEEIKRINLEIERVTIAYNLGEISEEEYVKTCSPMQNNLTSLKSKLKEIEEILEFLRKPLGIF
jgi:ABC-type antimicrobial peptide transport system permease subunit